MMEKTMKDGAKAIERGEELDRLEEQMLKIARVRKMRRRRRRESCERGIFICVTLEQTLQTAIKRYTAFGMRTRLSKVRRARGHPSMTYIRHSS